MQTQSINKSSKSKYQLILKGRSIILLVFILSCFSELVQSLPACTCASGTIIQYTDTAGVIWNHCPGASCSSSCIPRHYHPSAPGYPCVDQCEYQCVTNCNVCANATDCATCLSGYALMSPTLCKDCSLQYGTGCWLCNSTKCTTCYSNYVMDTSTSICIACSTISSSCSTCNLTNCLSCFYGYGRNMTTVNYACVSCTTVTVNCATCGDGLGCLTCISGYALSGSSCLQCSTLYNSNCLTCNTARCLTCASPFFLDSISATYNCVLCSSISQCTSCSAGPVCTACNAGYVLDNSQPNQACFPCSSVPNCQTCASGPACTTCAADSVKDYTSSTFQIKKASYLTTCFACSSIPFCTNCYSSIFSPSPYCSMCQTGYGRNYSQPRYPCVSCSALPNCQTCYDGPRCSGCNPGYCLDYSSYPYQCVAASSVPNCIDCINGPTCVSCGSGYYLDFGSANKSCVACNFISNCETCVDGPICTFCSAGYALNFIALNRTCTLCSSLFKCMNCKDGPVCTQCVPGFYLNATSLTCLPCHFPCTECSQAPTNCTKCPPSQLYFLSSTGTCDLCYNKLADCLKCDLLGSQCFQCNSTTTYLDLTTNQCVTCVTPCLNCLSKSQCLSCVDFTYLLDVVSYTCLPCTNFMPRCVSCVKSDVCTACDATGTYYLTYPPSTFFVTQVSCVTCEQARPSCLTCIQTANAGPECTQCSDKFYLSNASCYDCQYSCALCTSLTVCTSCINAYYTLSNQLCILCSTLIPNCEQCSSETVCTKCINGTIVDSAGSGTCIKCTSLQYTDEPNQLCQPCASPCETCLNADDCLTCLPLFKYIPAIKRCKDLCGDSVVISDPCDNGPGIYHDGCTDDCQQEPNYTCVNNSDNVFGQAVFRSICSYDLNLNITLFFIEKEPFKNTMTFTYLIAPFLYGLPGTTVRTFTRDELKQIFLFYENNTVRLLAPSATPGITVESVSVDATNSKVSVTFSYDHNIKQSDMELYVDFQYLKSTLALPNFVTTPDTVHLLKVSSYQPQSMIGKFYSEDQYSHASLLNKVAVAISALSFVTFLIGIFTKEVVGLEMAMLCQFTYISLFVFQGTLELPLFALKGLIFSTGYNLPLADLNFQVLDQDPPQSFVLGFDPRTFSNNFNLMTLLYCLPLIFIIPFIPLKAKCIRKISMIELGHKWVDLLLGEIMLFCVLFNFQYFLFGTIIFYQDGRDRQNYSSSMIIWLGMLCTVCSFFGLIFKPEIYGNFRMVFRYNDDLIKEVIEARQKLKECEEHLTKKFKDQSKCEALKTISEKFSLFVNENFLWRNHRRIHSAVTFNHYVILFVYFTLVTTLTSLVKDSAIITLCLSVILLIEVIIVRPYFEVSEKLRAIFFFVIYTIVPFVRFANNNGMLGENAGFASAIILFLLFIALIWTFFTLIRHFYRFATEQSSDRIQVVEKVFVKTDLCDRAAVEEEEAMIKKLMKRYERVELQYNVNNARAQLLSGYEELRGTSPQTKEESKDLGLTGLGLESDPSQTSPTRKISEDPELEDILKKAEEEKNYKDLKDELKKIHRKKKKNEVKKKVTGNKMLKLLKLDNFNKYENSFLKDEEPPSAKKAHQKIKDESQEEQEKEKIEEVIDEANQEDVEECESSQKDEYQSVEAQNLEEAEQKVMEQKIMIEENQFVRYERAREIIAKGGLTINRKLIAANYDRI